MIDTEARRSLHYADEFKFIHCQFNEPFGSHDYAEVIKAAAKESAEGVVIVDSMSHEHEGMGGYLMFHDAECERLGKGDPAKAEASKWRAWAKPAAARQFLINTILQIPAAFVFCFRAKEKSAMVKNNGRNDIVTLGWQAIAGDAFVFEQTIRCLLPPGAEGVADWSALAKENGVPKCPEALKSIMVNQRPLDELHGEHLALWAAGKTKATAAPARPRNRQSKMVMEHSMAVLRCFEWREKSNEIGKQSEFDTKCREVLAGERVKKITELAEPAQRKVVKAMAQFVEGLQK